ncbi:MAG: hypothetical protein AAGA50_14375 [Pseudomonadota bacterium]
MTYRSYVPALLFASVFLAGCQSLGGATNVVHKTGSTVEQRRSVIDACQVASLQDVPPAYKTRTTGGSSGFGGLYCTGWPCYGYRGYSYPATTISYDPNDKLRARQFQRCLRGKGYTVISRPTCTTEKDTVAYKNQKRQAPASRISCVAGEPRLQSRWVRTQ